MGAGADVDAVSGKTPTSSLQLTDWPPLALAARFAHTAAIKALLEARAEANATTSHRFTALMWAVTVLDTESQRLLLVARADVNMACGKNPAGSPAGWTALMAGAFMGNQEGV